ncbi:MAG: hypothetical protein KKG47_02420 [Proteobacteria bacterium]|nr:hypothetical protein [Pseudomonadota bacterium]MBU1738054.1 hypothetical protein [Pseudomonadota bacterium]
MKIGQYLSAIPVVLQLVLFLCSSALPNSYASASETGNGVAALQGVFLGKSFKAKLISIRKQDETLLISYDEKTEGLDDVEEGDNILLRYRAGDGIKLALEVIPEQVKIPEGVTEIDTAEMIALLNDESRRGKYLLVDCRPFDFYSETHLPTAVSIPWTESKEVKLAALPADREQLLIFYCLGGTCQLGPNSAALAVEAGYKNVRVILVELSEWQESGGNLYSGDEYIRHGNVVLVDLRSGEEAEAGHIPGAVNIPAGEISGAEYDFPTYKSAPVIVYGNGADPENAAASIRRWGFRQVSLVEGGFAGWVARGNPVETGKLSSGIRWLRQPDIDEVSIEDFQKAAAGGNDEALIIDVRTPEETAKGSFDRAVKIPLTELPARLAEVPDDKEIFLHCATGARAQMAWSYLRQHRNKVRYLQAKVINRKGKILIRP